MSSPAVPDVTLIVLAKQPRPGRVKTRLCPPLTPAAAAEVAAAALADTLEVCAAVPAAQRVLAFDGDPADWLPSGWRAAAQGGGDLDARLTAAFDAVGGGPALLVGMDTPQLTPALLTAFDPLRFDACLGPATDGGYWAIGLRDPRLASTVIPGVPMSRGDTGAVQLARLRAAGLRVQLLPALRDVDTIDDAVAVAALAPGSRFARTVGCALRPTAS